MAKSITYSPNLNSRLLSYYWNLSITDSDT
nr:MAG TPA: hypothetical protein [Bacteriophage sp.]